MTFDPIVVRGRRTALAAAAPDTVVAEVYFLRGFLFLDVDVIDNLLEEGLVVFLAEGPMEDNTTER